MWQNGDDVYIPPFSEPLAKPSEIHVHDQRLQLLLNLNHVWGLGYCLNPGR